MDQRLELRLLAARKNNFCNYLTKVAAAIKLEIDFGEIGFKRSSAQYMRFGKDLLWLPYPKERQPTSRSSN
ncbi:hypothetical protein AF332_06790 [Sporosarcina globispora]|uniref:Uncharacterized protein n=1 Tax=Sporosarcina globispora TaxID=1459 RepID=A0A0M0G9Y2_SPOGL|nr:hypothetical protein AF332_06790 [Sporosarcina globispora]